MRSRWQALAGAVVLTFGLTFGVSWAACAPADSAARAPGKADAGAAPAPGKRGGGAGARRDVDRACRVDADCRTFSDTCTGCDCRALAAADPPPACPGPGVRCLADPCLHKKAACRRGRCAIVADAPPARAAPKAHDPCAGKKCGELCRICPPSDPTCVETMQVKQCNAAGACTPEPPGCGTR